MKANKLTMKNKYQNKINKARVIRNRCHLVAISNKNNKNSHSKYYLKYF